MPLTPEEEKELAELEKEFGQEEAPSTGALTPEEEKELAQLEEEFGVDKGFTGGLKSAAVGAGQMLTAGHLDELSAGIRSAFDSDSDYEAELKEVQAEFEELKKEHPTAFTAGEIGSIVAPGGLAVKALQKSPKIWNALKKGAEALGLATEPLTTTAMKAASKILPKLGEKAKESLKSKLLKKKSSYAGRTK